MFSRLLSVFFWVGFSSSLAADTAVSSEIAFQQPTSLVECYDFVEITVRVPKPAFRNPFADVSLSGDFGCAGSSEKLSVEGFCDSPDGSVFRLRFMPSIPGDYVFTAIFGQGDIQRTHNGRFQAVPSRRKGPLRVDAQHPWHFIWEGTGEHCFLNGTTAFLLMGWENEQTIRDSVDRLSRLAVNRIRVLLDGRTDHFWGEPVKPNQHFRAHLEPWVAKNPENISRPGFDYTRFNCSYWQKYEHMLKHCRERDVNVSVIFGWNDTPVHPRPASDDERRYFRYALARLSAYANVSWDLGDDLDSFRDELWTHTFGTLIHQLDPYHHLVTSHPVQNEHQDRTSPWFTMTSFQQWKRPLHEWMLDQRHRQSSTGRIIPQMNEEYGYEDHYPSFAPYGPPASSADANRREAWGITMAGCYQTTGETARRGTGVPPDSGGGWVNGRGDDTMVMLQGYAHMVRFITSFPWWKAEPHDELVTSGAFCLADPGSLYVVYLPHGRPTTMTLASGTYRTTLFNPRTGESRNLPNAVAPQWLSPQTPDSEDWAFLLQHLSDAPAK